MKRLSLVELDNIFKSVIKRITNYKDNKQGEFQILHILERYIHQYEVIQTNENTHATPPPYSHPPPYTHAPLPHILLMVFHFSSFNGCL